MSTELLLEVNHLQTQFQTKAGSILAVNDVSLRLNKGEVLGLVGESQAFQLWV